MFSVQATSFWAKLSLRLPWLAFSAALVAPSAALVVLLPPMLFAPLAPRTASAAGDRGVLGKNHAVSTDSPLATESAMAVLARGGDAVDAAVAAVAMLGVVAPAGSGIGGGGFALVWRAKEKKVTTFDFRETAPAAFDAAAFEAREGASTEEKLASRGMLVGVPGEVMGLVTLHNRFGRLSLEDDLASAVKAAKDGFPLGRYLAEVLRGDPFKIASHPSIGPLFFDALNAGALRARGSILRRPALARTLDRLGAEGATAFYEGTVAAHMVAEARRFGSLITLADFQSRSVIEREPLMRTFGTRAVYTMGSPSAGGLMLLEALTLLGASPSASGAKAGAGSSTYLHEIAEIMRGALADRLVAVGDPAVDAAARERLDRMVDRKRLEARAAHRNPARAHSATEYAGRERGTSHVLVADDDGNIVSLTTTVNGPFGARIETEDGVLLNDELDDFTTRAEAKLFLGDAASPNRPRALARPVSSMMPTLILEDGEPFFALGGSGGRRIATACTQVVLRALLFGDDAAEAVGAPRIHVGAGLELLLEKDISPDVQAALRARGHEPKRDSMKAAVQAMRFTREGNERLIEAAADPRKYGQAAAH